MHFIAIESTYYTRDELKSICIRHRIRYRFDYRMKRWECYKTTISKKAKNELESFAALHGFKTHEWKAKDTYSKNVYKPKKDRT